MRMVQTSFLVMCSGRANSCHPLRLTWIPQLQSLVTHNGYRYNAPDRLPARRRWPGERSVNFRRLRRKNKECLAPRQGLREENVPA